MPSATISRRELIRLAGAAAAFAATGGGCSVDETVNPVPTAFFTADELAAIDALADVILPPDDQPGGAALGTSAYIEQLVTAFDVADATGATPLYFSGGPYSGRWPFGDGKGAASTDFPPNDFATFVPLDRVSEAALRLFLYGSKGLPGGGPNDKALGPIVGLRDTMKNGLATALSESSKTPIASMNTKDRQNFFLGLDPVFQTTFIELVLEAAFADPVYGGNPNGAGWDMVHFEGDSQPLGYSIYDSATGGYRERPDAPMTTPNPGPDPEPMDAATADLIATVTIFLGGTVFP